MEYVVGIDEVGRGPVAGPVVVVACALKKGVDVLPLYPKQELKDSKKLSEKNREKIRLGLDTYITSGDVLYGIGEVSAEEIDAIGIAESIRKATDIALLKLEEKGVMATTEVVLDGSLYAPERYRNQSTHIKGDEKFAEISLASIIAKVYRDNLMKELGKQFPVYGFENHAGYGTAAHYEAIKKHGFTQFHRKSFLKSLLYS